MLAALCLLASCSTPEARDGADAAPIGEEPVSGDAVRRLMAEKMMHANALLRAISISDLGAVERNARELAEISLVAEWQVHESVSYDVFSGRFRRAAADLAVAAREGRAEDLEAGYVRLTASCLACHEYLREEGPRRELPGRVAVRPGASGSSG